MNRSNQSCSSSSSSRSINNREICLAILSIDWTNLDRQNFVFLPVDQILLLFQLIIVMSTVRMIVAEKRGIGQKTLQVMRNRRGGGRIIGEVRRIQTTISIETVVRSGGEVLVTIAVVRAIRILM